MSRDINLLHKKDAKSRRREYILRVLRYVSSITLGVLLVTIGILYFLIHDPALASLARDEKEVLASLSLLQSKTAKIILLKERTKEIRTILKDRSDLPREIDIITEHIPAEITLTGVSLSKTTATLTLSTQSLAEMDLFLTTLTNLVYDKKIFQKITISGITSDTKTGTYAFSIAADLYTL